MQATTAKGPLASVAHRTNLRRGCRLLEKGLELRLHEVKSLMVIFRLFLREVRRHSNESLGPSHHPSRNH